MEREIFDKLVEEKLPKYIKVDGLLYRLSATQLWKHAVFTVDYAIYREIKGSLVFDWSSPRLISKHYGYDGNESLEVVLSDLNKFDYEVIQESEILTTEQKFRKELSELLEKYNKNRYCGTSTETLVNFLTGSLSNLKHAVKYIKSC